MKKETEKNNWREGAKGLCKKVIVKNKLNGNPLTPQARTGQ